MVRLRRTLDSDTLYMPELKPLLGKSVEITVEEEVPAVRDQFWAEAARLPETAEELERQRALFRTWRQDLSFEAYWLTLDQLQTRDLDSLRKWAVIGAQFPLIDYDFEAYRDQNACDLADAKGQTL